MTSKDDQQPAPGARTSALDHPADDRAKDAQRRDGRPSNATVPAPLPPADSVPTIAPEEEGKTPTTEHSPGGDL